MKSRIVKLVITGGIIFYFLSGNAQNTSKEYLVFKVTNSVIDCPHFGYIIPAEAHKKLNINLVEKNHERKRMVFSIPETSNVSPDMITTKFRELLDSLQFPPTMIDKIYWSKNKED